MSEIIERLNAALEGRYRIERELGEGGMATVYLAEDVKHARKVAVKVLRPELAAVVGAERFLAEIKTTASLQHPHILPLHDSGEADSFLFYVMPYIEGESLRDRLERDRQLPVDDAVEIARKIASALEYAHEQDIVHRDIKPANILMSRGEPLVADFGIALALSQAGGGRITETGLSLGTPHYMSPEQASGERSLDKRSDVYAAGAVLYEMLTGEPPYGGPTAQAVLARILTENPRRVTDIRRTVPPNVEAAVARALEKLPADRFDSAEAFREALADESFRHVTRDAPVAPVGPPAGDDRRVGGRGRGVLVLAGIAVVATLAAVAGWLRAPAQLDQPSVRVALDTDTLNLRFHEFTVSPDGSKLVLTGQHGLLLRTADDPEVRFVRGTEQARDPVFSPDGQWIAFSRGGEALQKVSVEGGSPLTLASTETGVFMPHWGAEGEIVFATPAGLYRVSETGGEPVQLNTAGRHPRLLPGGSGIVYTTANRGIGWTDPAGDSTRVLVDEGVHPVYVPEIGHILYGHPEGGLFAVPFDPERGEVTGAIRPVLDEVATGGFAAAFDVSGNGTLLYRRGGGGGGGSGEFLVIIDLDGGVDTLPLAPRDFETPRFSPDGRHLAFEADEQIYTYDLELGTTTQLTFEGVNHRPVWSPDGTRMAFASTAEGAAQDVLMVKAVDGATAATLVLDAPGDEHPVDWPLEDLLVFELADDGVDLMLVDPTADDPEARPYLQAEWNEQALSVSPDGALAAYLSGETGLPQVFVRRFPEPQGQWRISEGHGMHPHWSRAGDVIYYWASPAAEDSLIAARVRTEGAVVVESRQLITAGEYDFIDSDFDPVSDRFVVVQNVGVERAAEVQGLWLVVNWFTELQERLGGGGR